MKKIHIISILFLAFYHSNAQVSVSPQVIASAGGNSTTSNLEVSWTLGETFVTELSGGDLSLNQGFQQNDTQCLNLFNSSPENTSICQGNNATFSIQTNQAVASYQWEVNTGSGFVPVPTSTVYSGQNTSTLGLAFPPSTFNGYQYRCMVSKYGCSAPSAVATLSMSGSAEALNIVNINPISGVYSQTAVAYTLALNKIEPNAKVTYKSGNAIELLPGFETRTTSVFITKIESPCSNNLGLTTNFDSLPKEIRK